jgi:hypothetical protein
MTGMAQIGQTARHNFILNWADPCGTLPVVFHMGGGLGGAHMGGLGGGFGGGHFAGRGPALGRGLAG